MTDALTIRPAAPRDHDALQAIRKAAFAPVFASFRAIVGEPIARVAMASADDEQAALLASILDAQSPWETFVAVEDGAAVGFVALACNAVTRVGELGLNAVAPDHQRKGVGAALHARALERMKEQGMRVAAVGVGGDPSHDPARRAYERAGFGAPLPSYALYKWLG